MKITVAREGLLKALQRIISTVGSRSTLPVLGNVLLETSGGKLVLTTTDLEIRITTDLEAAVEREGRTTLPAKKLLALVGKFFDDEVSIESDERHHAAIVCGTSKFKLLGIAPADFPEPPEFTPVREIKFKGADLKLSWKNHNYFYDASGHYDGNGNTQWTESAGGGQSHENRPPWYTLCYIMRVK